MACGDDGLCYNVEFCENDDDCEDMFYFNECMTNLSSQFPTDMVSDGAGINITNSICVTTCNSDGLFVVLHNTIDMMCYVMTTVYLSVYLLEYLVCLSFVIDLTTNQIEFVHLKYH